MNLRRSSRPILVVAVFSKGWQLTAVVPHEPRIDDDAHAILAIIDERQRRDRAGPNAKNIHEQIGLAEAQPGAAKGLVQRLEIDSCVALGNNEEQLAFGIFEKQVFGVAAWQAALQALALCNRKDGFVLDGIGS